MFKISFLHLHTQPTWPFPPCCSINTQQDTSFTSYFFSNYCQKCFQNKMLMLSYAIELWTPPTHILNIYHPPQHTSSILVQWSIIAALIFHCIIAHASFQSDFDSLIDWPLRMYSFTPLAERFVRWWWWWWLCAHHTLANSSRESRGERKHHPRSEGLFPLSPCGSAPPYKRQAWEPPAPPL